MKYFYTGIIILALCLALCITCVGLLSRYAGETSALIAQAQHSADSDDFDAAEAYIRRAYALWDSHSGFFRIILRHEGADEVSATFLELIEYAQNDCTEEFEPSCAMLIQQIRDLVDLEQPHYYNILTQPACAQKVL